MDEIQIQNRMADMKKLIDYERRNVRLAVWGGKKEGGEDSDGGETRRPRKRGR